MQTEENWNEVWIVVWIDLPLMPTEENLEGWLELWLESDVDANRREFEWRPNRILTLTVC